LCTAKWSKLMKKNSSRGQAAVKKQWGIHESSQHKESVSNFLLVNTFFLSSVSHKSFLFVALSTCARLQTTWFKLYRWTVRLNLRGWAIRLCTETTWACSLTSPAELGRCLLWHQVLDLLFESNGLCSCYQLHLDRKLHLLTVCVTGSRVTNHHRGAKNKDGDKRAQDM
jgi:hypothetical protein